MSLTIDEIQEIDNILNNNMPFSSSQDNEYEEFSFDDDVKKVEKDSLSDDVFSEMDSIVNAELNQNNTNPILDKLSDEEKKLYQTGDVNYDLLFSMPAFDDKTLELYGLKNNSGDVIKKYIDPDVWDEWQKKGKIGIQEAWQRKKKYLGFITDEMIPFWGSSKSAADSVNVLTTFNRIKNGETVREQDEEKLRDYILTLAELQARGGYTFGGNVLDIITNSPAYIGEIATGIATSESGIGLGVLGTTLSKAAAIKTTKKLLNEAIKQGVKKEILKQTVKKQVAKEIRGEVVKQLPKVATTTLRFGATKIPQRYVGSFMDKQLSDGIAITPVGDVVFSDTDNTAINIMKAFGDTTFDVLTETAGFMFAPLASYISKPVRNFLPKSFYTNFDKLVKTKWGNMSTGEVLKKYGYDGVIEEMGEELLNRFLCQTFGINGLESYNLEGFLNNVLYKDDPSKWGQEAVSFAIMSMGGHATVKGVSSLQKYSAEKHFLDNGYIRMKGSQSRSEQALRKIFEEKNISQNNINEYFETHTEDDFRQALYDIKIGEADEKQILKDEKLETEAQQVKDTVYNMLTENGMAEDEADNISKLFKARSKIGQKWANGSALDWFNNLALRFKNDKQNNDPTLKGSVVYNQSAAMYKSPQNNFSDFYNQVQKIKNPKQKAYYTYNTNNNVQLDIIHDVVRHDNNKHSLSVNDWENLFKVIDNNIEDKLIANKSYYRGVPILLKIKSGNDYYGVSVEVFPKRNIITTAFKSTEKGVDTWIEKDKKKSAKTTAPNHQSGSSIASSNNVILGQTLNDIITNIRSNLNPIVNNDEQSYSQGTRSEDLKTFYQGKNEIKQLERGDGKLIDVTYYDNSDIENVKPLNIKTLKFNNFKNVKDIKKSDIKKAVFKDKDKIYATNNITKITAGLTVNNLKEIISSVFDKNKTSKYARLEKEIISNVEVIFQNAIPILQHGEVKEKNKALYDVQIVHRFALPVKLGKNTFLTMITIKQRTDFEQAQIDEFAIYDLTSQNEKMLDRSSMPDNSEQSRSQTSNISIADLTEFVNSNISKYEPKSYSQGGEEYDFTEQIFGPKRINIENKEEYDNFIDNFSSEEERAKITFTKNALNRPESIIELFENADRSSFLHEMGHLFLEDLINASKTSEEAKKELNAWNNYLGYTGGEYTEKMHEKFAKGFEVYLMNGKAPTNSIRKVFETFKDWLREIYNFVLTSDGALSEDVYKLYDSLFKDYNPEDTEVIRNIIASARSAYNNVKEGNKPLNDEQKRYKETAYDILSYGLNMNKSYLKKVLEGNSKKYAKQAEKIENAIANIDDAFSSREGMLPEWKEFFNDTGVSYDNQEVGGDYELAQKAYDVIVNRKYLNYDWDYSPNEFDPALFEKLNASYNYILDLYRNGISKQKDYAIAAMYEWLEKSLPDERYQEEFTEMFEHDVNEIDRHENMSAFEIAKEVILNNANKISDGDVSKFRKIVLSTLNNLDFLTASDKTKLFTNLMQYNSSQELINDIDSIMDIAETMDSQNYFKTIENKIQKALEGTKNIKQGNKYVGKYTREVNAVFEDLRRYNRMQKQQARKELEMINLFEGEDTDTLSFEDKLRRKFLYYKATPSMYVSNDLMSDLYTDIKTLKNWGFLGKQREKLLKKVDANVKVEKLLRVLDKKKDAKAITKGYISGFGNWESMINAIFDEKTKNEYSLLDKQAQVQVWQNKQKQEFMKRACNIFQVDSVKLDNILIDKLAEKHKFLEYGAKRNHLVELNKMYIIEAFIWYKNENLKERLINMYGEDGLTEMFKLLDKQEIEFANLLQRTAEKFYDEANKVYIRKYGIELPKVKNYFPSKTERVTVVDLLNDFAVQSATTPSFIKNRTNSTFPIMKFDNPVNVLFSHIDKMGVFINMTDTIDLYNKIFTDTDLKKSIIEKYGESSYKALGQMLANSSYNKQSVNIDSVNKAFSKIMNNFISSKIILKPSIMIKQLLSCVNYAENMPVGEWCGGFLKAISNPKKTIDFMMQDDYLKTRFQTGGQNEYLQHVIEHSRFAKSRKFIDFLSLNVKVGDIGAIIFGGKPYIDYLMKKKGMTKENAFKEFRLSTMRSQQASMSSSLSNFQNNYNNPWVRGLFSFRNTPNQYFRKVADAFVSYSNGDISKTQCAKTVFIYTFLNAFMYNTATTLSIVAFALNGGDDDDDLKSDIVKSLFDFNSQAVPVIGDIYSYVLDRLMGKNRRGDVSIPAVTDLFEIVETVTSDDVTLEDYFDCMTSLADITTGFPVQSASNMVMGGVDVAGGKPSGLLRMSGYTKKRSEKVLNQ